MNQKKQTDQPTRRDWFRLRRPHQNRLLGQPDAAASSTRPTALKPVDLPPNHDGMDMSQLPPMREALLSADQVHDLMVDVKQLGTDIQLMQRQAGANRATVSDADTPERLDLAGTALLSGRVPRLQVRYRWQDTLWIDTLTTQPDGYALIRIAHRHA